MALAHALDHVVHQLAGELDVAALELPFQLGLALHDVLVPLLLFEPGADFVAGLAGAHQREPVPVGALARLFGGEDFDNLAGFHLIVQGDDALVHLGANHPVAHGAVYGVGKVDDGGAQRQVDDVPSGGEHEHLLGDEVAFDGVHQVGDVLAFGLVFQHLANPGQAVVQGGVVGVLGGHAQLVLPVGGDAVLGGVVHLPGADLHLEGDARLGDNRGVQGLVHVGLGHGDVVLKPVGQGLEHIVDDAQHVVAVLDGVHNDAHGEHVVNLVEGLALDEHLPVDAINAFHTALDVHVRDGHLHPAADKGLGVLDELLAAVAAGCQIVLNFPVGQGVQVL